MSHIHEIQQYSKSVQKTPNVECVRAERALESLYPNAPSKSQRSESHIKVTQLLKNKF